MECMGLTVGHVRFTKNVTLAPKEIEIASLQAALCRPVKCTCSTGVRYLVDGECYFETAYNIQSRSTGRVCIPLTWCTMKFP